MVSRNLRVICDIGNCKSFLKIVYFFVNVFIRSMEATAMLPVLLANFTLLL